MKKKNLTRKLIIASIIWLFLICVACGAYFWLDNDIESLTNQTQADKGTLITKQNELESVAKNIKNSEMAMSRFIDFSKSDDNDKNFFRKNAIVRKLGEITSELNAIQLSFKMSPFEKYPTLPSSDKVDVVYSRVSLEYRSLTDITAFKLLKLISEKLNGTVYYKKFTIEKIGEIDSDVLLKISEGQTPSLVKGDIEFDWISIRLKDLPPKETPAVLETPTEQTPPTLTEGGSDA